MTTINNLDQFQKQQQSWIATKMKMDLNKNTIWSQSLAVGSADFVERIKDNLGEKAESRAIVSHDEHHFIKEEAKAYNGNFNTEKAPLSSK